MLGSKKALIAAAAFFLAQASAAQTTPLLLPYSGSLDVEGVPAEGVYAMTFALFESATSDTALHRETLDVQVVGGQFSVVLGESATNPISRAALEVPEVYLALSVAGPDLSGRQRIIMPAYAGRASAGSDAFAIGGALGSDEGWTLRRHAASGSLEVVAPGSGVVAIDIAAGAKQNSLVATESGVGVGTPAPAASLHVAGAEGETRLVVEETSPAASPRTLLALRNNGPARLSLLDTSAQPGVEWELSASPVAFLLSVSGTGVNQLQLDTLGNLSVTGSFRVAGTTLDVPDYVFEPSYALRSPASLEAYISEHHHLPGVPSASEVQREGMDLAQMQLRLLEKVEELSLYVIEQDKSLAALKRENAALEARLKELERRQQPHDD